MFLLARLILCRALSGLIVDCLSTFTQGVALGSYLPRPWRWIQIMSCPERVHPEWFTLKGIIYKPRAPPWDNEIRPHYTSPVRVHPEGFTLKGETYWNSYIWRFSTEQFPYKINMLQRAIWHNQPQADKTETS